MRTKPQSTFEPDAMSQSTSWTRTEVVAFVSSISLGVILRVWNLAGRPLHHDESIHATFSYYWFDHPATGAYQYNPTYHGPFLYWCVRWIFEAFGLGITQARIFPVMFGLGIVASPLLIRRWLGRRAALVAVAILATSPLLVYYSRFLIHDLAGLFFSFLAVACIAHSQEKSRRPHYWIAGAAGALGVLFSIKAIAFLHCFIGATFGLFYLFATQRTSARETIRMTGKFLRSAPIWLAGAVFLASYSFFQTAEFRYPGAFADGLFRKVLPYWWGQHSIERLGGPTIFHLRSLLLHEGGWFVPGIVLMALAWWRSPRGRWIVGSLGVVGLATLIAPFPLTGNSWGTYMVVARLKSSEDIFLYALCAVGGLYGTYHLLVSRKILNAFINYWAFASLMIYSFAGEKGPWLTVHPAFPFALCTAIGIAAYWRGAPRARQMALAMGCLVVALFQLRQSYFTSHYRAGEPTELLSQVHNTKDIPKVVDWMKRVAFESGYSVEKFPIAIVGAPVWAFYFNVIVEGFRGLKIEEANLTEDLAFIVTDEVTSRRWEERLKARGYQLAVLSHNGWWVPEHGKVSYRDWARYFFTRTPPVAATKTPLYVYTRAVRSKAE